MILDNVLHIAKSKSESLDIVAVARVYAEEFFKNLLKVLSLDADAVVLNVNANAVVVVVCVDFELRFHVLTMVFDGIVEQVEEHVGDVHFVGVEHCVFGVELRDDFSTHAFDLKAEGGYDVVDDFVDVKVFALEGVALFFEH